jgi:hypothetical protein
MELRRATDPGVTAVVGARVVIVTGDGDAGLTGSVYTGFTYCAGVSIVTDVGAQAVAAAGVCVADVDRTHISVVAAQVACARRTGSLGTLVADTAHVAVIAGGAVGAVATPGLRVAAVVGAALSIVAVRGACRDAASIVADAEIGAGVPVVTDGGVGRMGASVGGVTAVVGAAVLVVAIEGNGRHTCSFYAMVVHAAAVPIVAAVFIGRVGTAFDWIAGVGGAGVGVIAGDRLVGGAGPVDALIVGGACVPIVAAAFVGAVETSVFTAAGVVGAGVFIITEYGGAAEALPAIASIAQRTGIPIFTQHSIVLRRTSRFGFASIVRAGVFVITSQGICDAIAGDTHITDRACVPIVAADTIERGVDAAVGAVTLVFRTGVSVVA